MVSSMTITTETRYWEIGLKIRIATGVKQLHCRFGIRNWYRLDRCHGVAEEQSYVSRSGKRPIEASRKPHQAPANDLFLHSQDCQSTNSIQHRWMNRVQFDLYRNCHYFVLVKIVRIRYLILQCAVTVAWLAQNPAPLATPSGSAYTQTQLITSPSQNTRKRHVNLETLQCWLHWIVFRSIPSCTSSHSGLSSRKNVTRSFTAFST